MVVQQPTSVIKIEPASPQVVYVPSYNPTVVYGAWPYPAYPPYSPYPPGYAWGAAALSFGVGMAVGAAVWGNCNWGGGNVDVDVNRNSNFTRNVNRTEVAASRSARVQERQAGGRSQWQHNPENRQGVQYRDQRTQQRYNRGSNPQAVQSREAFRGRAEQGRQELSRGGGAGGAGRRARRRRRWAGRQGGARAANDRAGARARAEGGTRGRFRGWDPAVTSGAPAIGGRAVARASARAAEEAPGRPAGLSAGGRGGAAAAAGSAQVGEAGAAARRGRRRWRARRRRRRAEAEVGGEPDRRGGIDPASGPK